MIVRLSAGGRFMVGLAAAFAIGAIVAAVILSSVYVRGRAAAEARIADSAPARGHVLEVVERGSGDDRRWVATYAYEIDGVAYTGQARFQRRDRRSVTPGSELPITYLRSNPARSWRVGQEPRGMPLAVVPLMSLTLLFVGSMIAWQIRSQWILLSEGRVVPARVTGHKKIQQHGGHTFRVNCEFKTLSGAKRQGRFEAGRNAPADGATMTIIYHRDDPDWHARYPLQFVRATREGE